MISEFRIGLSISVSFKATSSMRRWNGSAIGHGDVALTGTQKESEPKDLVFAFGRAQTLPHRQAAIVAILSAFEYQIALKLYFRKSER